MSCIAVEVPTVKDICANTQNIGCQMTTKEKSLRCLLYSVMALGLIALSTIHDDGILTVGAGVLIFLAIYVWRL